MFVKQISVYLENVKGSLRELMEMLGKGGINLLALSIADTTGFGIVRCIVRDDDVDPALDIIRANGLIAQVNDIICIKIPHRPLGLATVLSILESNNIGVEYCYSFCRSTADDAVMIIRPSDKHKCAAILTAEGVEMISQSEVDGF